MRSPRRLLLLGAFDARTLAPLQDLAVTNVIGAPSSLVRVRDDGFAFRTDAGHLVVVRATAAGYGPPADLAVSAPIAGPRVTLGSNITLTATVTNRGPGNASNVVLSLPVPAAAAIVTSSTPYTVYSSGLPGMKFSFGTLTNGVSTNIAITLRTTAAGVLRAITAVVGNADDTNQANNVAAVDVLVVFPPNWTGVNFLSLPAQDLAYDQGRNVFYLSSGAETVAVVSPDTGEVLGSFFAGPSTGRLKITDNGEFLYVTVSNGAAIARVKLANASRDLLFDLGLTSLSNPYIVTDLEPLPGAPHSVVVGTGHPLVAAAAVTVYDDGIARPLSPFDDSGGDYLEFADTANRVYATGRGGAFRRFRTLEITSNGVQEIVSPKDVPPDLRDFEYAAGSFYATTGDILAPATGAVVGHINGLGSGTLVEPDAAQSRVYFLTPLAGTDWRLLVYELGGLSPVASLSISNVVGTPVNLVRWGTNRLAFNTSSNMLYLVKAEARVQFTSLLSNSVVLAHQPLVIQWNLSNAGPATTVVTVSNRVPAFANFANGSAASGLLSLTNGDVRWTLTNLTSNATNTALVQFVFTNITDLLVTNQSVAFPGLSDPQGANTAVTLVFAVLADNDQDGLGDTWELSNFGNLSVAPGADADGDGRSNLQEFVEGTDPHDAGNVLRIISFTASPGTVSISFFASRGKTYALETSASVTGPWTEIRPVSGESTRVTLTEKHGPGPAFYRVRRLP